MTLRRAVLLLAATSGFAQEWTQWRGPNRDGVAAGFRAPASWPAALTRRWSVPAGSGYSSPVVSATHIFAHTREQDQEVVGAFERASGKLAWRKSYPAAFQKNKYALSMGQGPFSTPLLQQGRLFTLGATAILSCWDARTGGLLWRHDYSGAADTSRLFTGTAMSPAIDEGRLLIHTGDDSKGVFRALDAATGTERWRWEGDGPGYASPLVVTLGGTRQIVTLTDRRAIGLAAADGALLWSIPFKDEWNENIVTPVFHEGRLIFSGVRTGTFALEITRGAGAWTTKKTWDNSGIAMYMSSPVLDGPHLYGLSSRNKGQFFCLDASTGRVLWTTTGRETQNASLVSAGEFLLLLTAEGELIVTRKNPQRWVQVARYTVSGSPAFAHPVLLGEGVLIKDDRALSLWDWAAASGR